MVAKVEEAAELMGLMVNMDFIRPCLSHCDVLLFMGKLMQAKELQAAYLEERSIERLTGKQGAASAYLLNLEEKWQELVVLADAITGSLPEQVVIRAKSKLSRSPQEVRRYLQTQVEDRFHRGCLLRDLKAR